MRRRCCSSSISGTSRRVTEMAALHDLRYSPGERRRARAEIRSTKAARGMFGLDEALLRQSSGLESVLAVGVAGPAHHPAVANREDVEELVVDFSVAAP